MAQSNFIIYGPEISEAATFEEISVAGVEYDGTVQFEVGSTGRSVSLSSAEMSELNQRDLILNVSKVSSLPSDIRGAAEKIDAAVGSQESNAVIRRLNNAREQIFQAAAERSG